MTENVVADYDLPPPSNTGRVLCEGMGACIRRANTAQWFVENPGRSLGALHARGQNLEIHDFLDRFNRLRPDVYTYLDFRCRPPLDAEPYGSPARRRVHGKTTQLLVYVAALSYVLLIKFKLGLSKS